MINLLVCLCHRTCGHEFALNQNALFITISICATILVFMISCMFIYGQFSKVRNLEDETKQLNKDLKDAKDKLSKAEKQIEEQNEQIKKKDNEFLDFCYKMAKSLDYENETLKADCWKIILYQNIESVPDELKKEYKIDNN